MKPHKVVTLKRLLEVLKRERRRGKKVVFTNGCFDIIHPGHIYLLSRAKKLGDILVVGVNSDSSVKRIKGEERPYYSQRERTYILSALVPVDYIVIFNAPTPLRLIEKIKPDVLVKGSDWKKEDIVGREVVERNGGRVVRIPLLKGFSTTSIVERVKHGRASKG